MTNKYNFETLARADKEELEHVLLQGATPDINQLDGYSYCGWNHEPIGKITGRKFKKSFVKKISDVYGFNQKIKQDSCGHSGQWDDVLVNGLPSPMGFFKVSYVKDEPCSKLHRNYNHLALFNYNISFNRGLNSYFKVIRDFMVLPNKGDHSLLLGKAYVHLPGQIDLFACYFLLGHPQRINQQLYNF
ncbi:MAG: hypothetical protein ABUT20_05535 [Bacteroidota bacterium]